MTVNQDGGLSVTDFRGKFGPKLAALCALAEAAEVEAPVVAPARSLKLRRLVELARGLTEDYATPTNDFDASFLIERRQDILWRLGGAASAARSRLTVAERELMEVLEITPGLLEPMGLERDERTHSSIIAWLLDPSRSGAIGEECLRAFAELLSDPSRGKISGNVSESIALPPNSGTRMEVWIGDGERVDVVVESQKALVYIEVKVDAAEGQHQLQRYADALQANVGTERDGWLVFLTADAEAQSACHSPFRHISFEDLLVAWLPIAARRAAVGSSIFRMYLKTVAASVVGVAGLGSYDAWPASTKKKSIAFISEFQESIE